MSKILVTFVKDWADEFDVHGFAIYEKDEWEQRLKDFMEHDKWNGFFFGTNEGWYDDYSKEDFVRAYRIKDISDEEVIVFQRLFGYEYNDYIEFGTFPHPSELMVD